MIYRIAHSIDHKLVTDETSDILAYMEVRGVAVKGFNTKPTSRPELNGQPKFEGFSGPFWDGDAVRYESRAAYETLSA